MLSRLAHWCYRRRRLVLGLWILLLIGSQVASSAAGGKSSMSFKLPASDSQRAQDLLAQRFATESGATGEVVIAAPAGVKSPAVEQRAKALFDQIARTPHVVEVTSPYSAPGANQISGDGTIAFAQVHFDQNIDKLKSADADQVKNVAAKAGVPGFDVALSGNMFQSRKPPGGTELVGVLAAMIILLIAFGSVLAMGLPILTALFGIGVGLAGVSLLANVFSMPSFASILAAMIGIGVGIDYALFIVTRYRQGLHAGLDPERAIVKSVTTSGKAVLFAGSTVVISLLGMFAMGLSFVRGLAVGASLAVVFTMAASVTLLPAVLGFVGPKIDKLALPWTQRSAQSGRTTVAYRWSRLIQRRPWTSAGVGFIVLVLLALPVFSITLGSSDAGNNPKSDTTRVAYDLLAKGFGPGFNSPLLIAVDVPNQGAATALPALHDAIARVPGVAEVTPPRLGPSATAAVLQVFPTTGPQDQKTVALMHDLRAHVIPAAIAGTGLVVHIGGNTATFADLSSFLGSHLPIFMLVVLGLSFLLLLVVFRSLVVPLKAVIMNVLSIGAAYGLLVAVFQWGWGAGLIGIGKKGPIESFIPMMMFAVIFGLSMDYEIFLLSRIKEEFDKTRNNAEAVADGLAHTARVITAAAAIMVCVFGSFVLGGERVIKEFGLGLAAAILIDATLVRMILVPATMELLGDANWWLPRWLARILPNIHIEGTDDDEMEAELSDLLEHDGIARREL
ncbi:MAG: putative drug exporter of the superfamily [Actinomycetota bacterium]|nr:putative drug exporter of the superfamily [Actinomycetota bacterium]